LLLFAAAGAVGGHYAYACPEGLSAACRSAEWHLKLPLHHYLHVISGVIEFAAITMRSMSRGNGPGRLRLVSLAVKESRSPC